MFGGQISTVTSRLSDLGAPWVMLTTAVDCDRPSKPTVINKMLAKLMDRPRILDRSIDADLGNVLGT